MAFALRGKCNALNDAYREVHVLISHSKPIATETITHIQTCIATYMALYRINFFKKCDTQATLSRKALYSLDIKIWFGFGIPR